MPFRKADDYVVCGIDIAGSARDLDHGTSDTDEKSKRSGLCDCMSSIVCFTRDAEGAGNTEASIFRGSE